jgi:hypothetical protein
LWGKDRVVNAVSADGKTYSTLDLTLFKLEQNTSLKDILFIREEYRLAYDTILADTHAMNELKWRKSAFLITGQPGIGASSA